MPAPDGFSNDELLAIGTRKQGLNLPISATDINRSIPFHASEEARRGMDGFSDAQLKDIAEGKIALPSMRPEELISPRVGMDTVAENVLAGLQRFLNIRVK